MKFGSIASVFLLASAASAQSDQCDSLTEIYPAANSIAGTRTSGQFKIPDQGAFQCTLQCDTGSDFDVYVKFGSAGSISSTNNDFSAQAVACGASLEQTNQNGDVTGLQWIIESPNPHSDITWSCACKTAEENQGGGGGCFSADATVQVRGKGSISMKDLQVNDNVLVGNGKYEPVYDFGHYDKSNKQTFVQIHTEASDKTPIELTDDHFIFVASNSQSQAVPAGQVQVGDVLAYTKETVTKISLVNKEGMYMPLTPSGKIMVNGQQASTYVSLVGYGAGIVQHPALRWWLSESLLFHAWLSPYRIACMGISASFCESNQQQQTEGTGILNWLLTGQSIMQFLEGLPLLAQIFLFAFMFFPVLGFSLLMEALVGPAMAPTALVLGAYSWALMTKKNIDEVSTTKKVA